MARFAYILILALLAALAGCDDSSSSEDGTGGPESTPDTFRDAGPFAAGVTTLTLADRQVEVWYPVDPGSVQGLEKSPYFIRDYLSDIADSLLPPDLNPPYLTDAYRDVTGSSDGPFPLVLFSHGSPAFRTQSTFLTTHLATWGFVVASVDHFEWGLQGFLGSPPEPRMDDVELRRMVVALLEAETNEDDGVLAGIVSTVQIAVTGHSAGRWRGSSRAVPMAAAWSRFRSRTAGP
jgi:predicted dienelactone hydrolase